MSYTSIVCKRVGREVGWYVDGQFICYQGKRGHFETWAYVREIFADVLRANT